MSLLTVLYQVSAFYFDPMPLISLINILVFLADDAGSCSDVRTRQLGKNDTCLDEATSRYQKWRKDQGSGFKSKEADRKRASRAKAKAKKAEKNAAVRDRLIKLSMRGKELQNVNTILRNQMFSDMAVSFKARGIEK